MKPVVDPAHGTERRSRDEVRGSASILQPIGQFFAKVAREVTPNPFVFAILLTGLVFLMGLVLTDSGPFEMVQHWYDGFWSLLGFAMQMVLILVAGYVLATSPPMKRGIARLAARPRNAREAIILVAVITIIMGWINWGLGVVTGAVLAIAVSSSARQRGIRIHYPLVAAAGYMAMLIFGGGLSSSAALLVNTEGHFLQDEIGLIPVSETILSPFNLITCAAFLLVIPILLASMHPPEEESIEVSPHLAEENGFDLEPEEGVHSARDDQRTIAERLDASPLISYGVALVGLGFAAWHFATRGFDLNIDLVNFLLVMFGLVIYGSPIAYVRAIEQAVRAAGGIVLQFPFYAGIMGMMSGSGLVLVLAEGMLAVSNEYTFSAATFVSAAIVNFAVPSAGGQWAVQGPILTSAAESLGVAMGPVIIAFSYGDALTNMIQPFWALPLLGITELKARDLLGYTAVAMIAAFFIFGFGISVLPWFFGR